VRVELGDLGRHFPANSEFNRRNLRWGGPHIQQVLDTALAWAVVNGRFEVADLLLARGADINTRWGSHEPASILHECAIRGDFEGARFLIAHGVDLTIKDHRWNATAAGWAWHAANDKEMAKLLTDAEEERKGDG